MKDLDKQERSKSRQRKLETRRLEEGKIEKEYVGFHPTCHNEQCTNRI